MNHVSLLSAALGLPVKPPTAPITRSIRMLFKNRERLEPYQEKVKKVRPPRDPMALSPAMKMTLRVVNKGGEHTSFTLAEHGLPWTQNHCSILLTRLHRLGLIKRRKECDGSIRRYVYSKKETT